MQMTLTEANRKAQQLRLEAARILSEEENIRTYAHSEGEKPLPQAYDFAATQARLNAINNKVARIRHAVSLFNVTHQVSGMEMTIDEALVRISMLSEMKRRLDQMAVIPEVERHGSYRVVEFVHRNFDVDEVRAEAERITDELNRLRAALDLTNLTSTIEITPE